MANISFYRQGGLFDSPTESFSVNDLAAAFAVEVGLELSTAQQNHELGALNVDTLLNAAEDAFSGVIEAIEAANTDEVRQYAAAAGAALALIADKYGALRG